ncbi:unnamed protein product [Cochlearia groenlandica]
MQSLDNFCIEVDMENLRQDKQVLMMELVKLKQQQQSNKMYVTLIKDKLKKVESKQRQMMSFLARAMHNPNFIQQPFELKEIEEVINKKRQRPLDKVTRNVVNVEDYVYDARASSSLFVDMKQETYGDMFEFEMSELDRLAMHIQGLGDESNREELVIDVAKTNEEEVQEGYQKESMEIYGEDYWEYLLNEGDEEMLMC